MAGDWIKMRSNLWDDPRVAKLCDLTDQTEAAIVGGLYWLWSSADQHTEDGCMPGLTLRQIDRKTGIVGFGAALCEVGWIADGAQGIVIQRFEEHNGTSAKRRCTDAQRKANGRNMSASEADINRTDDGGDEDEKRRLAELEKEKEKRKEKKPPTPLQGEDPPGFVEFWATWPSTERKVARKQCAEKWRRHGLSVKTDLIVAHVQAMKQTRQWSDGYEPAPLTYLNGERWKDGVPHSSVAAAEKAYL